MSEYWKSTPKYWCRYCKVFVKDTKFEKQQHEGTGRHQGNIQRSLRILHKDNEREERDKSRAQAEVARLNGIVSGDGKASTTQNSKPTSADLPWNRKAPTFAPPPQNVKTTREERMRQAEQLAAMGGVIPDEFRKDLALVGQWQTVSITPVVKQEEDGTGTDARAVGVRKRRLDETEQEEQEVTGAARPRKAWGSAFKKHPHATRSGGDDLDALLGGLGSMKEETGLPEAEPSVDEPLSGTSDEVKLEESKPAVKAEHGDNEASDLPLADVTSIKSEPLIKSESSATESASSVTAPPMFKKRRPKAAQQT